MKKHLLSVFFSCLVLAGCATPQEQDETRQWSASRLLSEAKNELSEGNYTRAIQLFEKVEARFPYGRFAQQAQLELAYTHFKDQEPALALADCDRFIKLHPAHPNVDYAYYLKGLIHFNEEIGLLAALASQDMSERDPKAAREAFFIFKELTTRFPNSRYAEDSQVRMAYLMNALSKYELHVARYYLKRHAYLAAANRSKSVLENFPSTQSAEPALLIMRDAYLALGKKDLAADVQRVLEKNYPKSLYLKSPHPFLQDKEWWKLW